MDTIRAITLFVRVADLQSFTAAATATGLSKSMISKEINKLEESMGTRLLHRSTRHLSLTPIGEGYLRHCREILLKLSDAESFVQDLHGKPKGKLKISVPMALGLSHLAQVFVDFMKEYPDVELDIHLGDEPSDLIEQGFDLGFRIASKTFDSNYIGKRLGEFSYRICAAPDYLETHPAIKEPRDLLHHNCFIYSYFRGKDVWPLDNGLKISGQLKVNSTPFMLEAIKRGLGIGFLPEFVCQEALAKGLVQEILASVKKPKLTLYALYPARLYIPLKLVKCIEYLEQWFRNSDFNPQRQAQNRPGQAVNENPWTSN